MPAALVSPTRLAALEAAGWKAYYDRRWLTAFWLLVRLSRDQFVFSWPDAIRGAYWIVRASIAFAAREGPDPVTARAYLTRYYRVARRALGARWDPKRIAGLEIAYWVVHRRLVGASDRRVLVDVLCDLHAALFSLSLEAARPSAEHRARAAEIVDGITNGWSEDVAGDWRRLKRELALAYNDIAERTHQPTV